MIEATLVRQNVMNNFLLLLLLFFFVVVFLVLFLLHLLFIFYLFIIFFFAVVWVYSRNRTGMPPQKIRVDPDQTQRSAA